MAKEDEKITAVLLHSGGIDSSVLGHYLNEQKIDYISLFFRHEQTPVDKELEAVRKTASILRARLDVIDMIGLRSTFTSSSRAVFMDMGNPGKHVLELGSPLLYAPALAYAHRLGIATVYVGLTKYDAGYTAEYRQPFLVAFSALAETAGYSRITFEAPFLSKSKADVIKLGAKVPGLLAATWTCFNDFPQQCGICESCESRKAAFRAAKVKDHTIYQDNT
jgi:7-cyano-7-deazaguanine synthase